jgi:metal-sulfur cluster biosynthetic enzyme
MSGYRNSRRGASVWMEIGTLGGGMDDVPDRYLDALRDVYDPCCREKGISVVDMGLVRSVVVRDGQVRVELLLTSGWCPFASRVLTDVRDRIIALPEVGDAEVDVVWDEAWTTDRLSASAARKLNFLPSPAQVPNRDAYVMAHMKEADGDR